MCFLPKKIHNFCVIAKCLNISGVYFQGNLVSIDSDGDVIRVQIGAFNHNNGKRQNKKENRIISTKYTLLTFIPQNLFEVRFFSAISYQLFISKTTKKKFKNNT